MLLLSFHSLSTDEISLVLEHDDGIVEHSNLSKRNAGGIIEIYEFEKNEPKKKKKCEKIPKNHPFELQE